MDYKSAGVDISGGDAWIDVIKRAVGARGDALRKAGEIGSFSGLFPIGGGRSLAACTDGVGTKIEVARAAGIFRGLGQDLVAMSVNDLVTCGASPLFFLDYIALGRLDTPRMAEVLEGVLDGCVESRCALLGGETAEMPGVYGPDQFDLAGFAVGIVDDDKIIDGSKITAGCDIVGIKSSGVHSNGYSLVRAALLDGGLKLSTSDRPEALGGETLGESLLRPTRIYVRQALAAIERGLPLGMAHITGGGLEGNIVRVIPRGLHIEIDYSAWQRPAIFGLIASAEVSEDEMRRVFNLGIGFAFITRHSDTDALVALMREIGEEPAVIGQVRS